MNLPLIDRVIILESQVRLLEGSLKGAWEKLDSISGLLEDLHVAREKVKERMLKARKGRKRA